MSYFLNTLLFKNGTTKEFSSLICLCVEVATIVSPEFLLQVCDNLNVREMFEISKSVECSSSCEICQKDYYVQLNQLHLV